MKKENFTSIGRIICLFLCLFVFSLASYSQGPAASITGPLKAYVNGSNITITSQIDNSSPTPTLVYTFPNNSSGASIVSTDPFVYDSNTDSGKQTIVINPGSTKGSFNILLKASNRNGFAECSMSITVTNNRSIAPPIDPNTIQK